MRRGSGAGAAVRRIGGVNLNEAEVRYARTDALEELALVGDQFFGVQAASRVTCPTALKALMA